jgi:hypothetical protein
MAKKILIPYDFNKNEIQNVRVQNLSSAPSSPVEGQMYYDTTLHQFGVYQNSTWTYLSAGVSNAVTRASAAGQSGELMTSAGADRSAQSFTTNGMVKIASGVVAQAVAGTDYVTGSSTNTLTNKTFDAQGTGNSLSNIATSMFAANVIDTDGTLGANSDTRIASQKATKTYIDAAVTGLKWKASVRAATTANGTLASAYANGQAIDGVTLVTGDRILLKNQTSGSENGIYIVAASGAPARATDADSAAELIGMVVDVQEGTTNADTAWVLTNDTITLGTTSLTYVDFIKSNVPTATTSIAGKVFLATQAEAEAKSDTSKAVVSADLVNFPIKKIFTIGDNSSTAIVVTHNLATQDIVVSVRDASTNAFVEADITATSTNTATITFAVAPASNAYKVVIIG